MSEIGGKTRVTGIIGYPLTYTLSPAMHNEAFKVLDLDYRYLPFVVEEKDLKSAIEGMRALKIRGLNVTMPHKEAVVNLLDELSPEARDIGAVNTINNENGRLIGYNTDATGFLKSLIEESFDPAGKTAVVLGTGGAAKAVVVALAQAGTNSIAIIGRSVKKAELLKDSLVHNFETISAISFGFDHDLTGVFKAADLIVNTTPVGMKDSINNSPIPSDLINPSHFVYDLIYSPLETMLMKEAKARGARAANGMGMLLQQAAVAFEIWTGAQAPVGNMHQALIGEVR